MRWWTALACWAAVLALQAIHAPWWRHAELAQADSESASITAGAEAAAQATHAARALLPGWQAFASWYPWALLGLIGLAIFLVDHRQRAARRRETTVLEQRVSDARLETLRTQLDPHFLFNALHAISAHLEPDPRAARWMLEQLGSLLRMSLEQAREQETPLARELEFIACYLHLQQARFDNRLDVVMAIEPGVRHALVPSLILQPLVENAIRHGVAHQPAARIEIRARREADDLRLSVHDDGPGLPADWDPEHGLGVGLSITRERLHRLYGSAQRFTIAGDPGSGVQVALTLPFRPGPELEEAAPAAAVEAEPAPTAAGGARTRTADDSPGS